MKHPPAYYADYLQLDKILSAQSPRSAEFGKPAHDEMLFITTHQVFEIWFKQILHELDSVREMFLGDYVDEKSIGVAVSRLNRVATIQSALIEQFRILETMTPLDFLEFRDFLSPASGFQSVQFRLIENKLGLKRQARLDFNDAPYDKRLSEAHQALAQRAEIEPSLFDLVERWLERTPFLKFGDFDFWRSYKEAVERMLDRDRETIERNPTLSEAEKIQELSQLSRTIENFAALFSEEKHKEFVAMGARRLSYAATKAALLIMLYRDQPILHLPFRLLTALVEIDESLAAWRYRHALVVQRMIGTKIGTGGSSGHAYLKQTIDAHRIFTDFFNLSTFLIPRSALPELPAEAERELGFFYGSESLKK
ncbi:MAG: tryptophan 2,3-dioxygenase [Chloroherpetonaceae bacterium]|nr:tryptophan 2,3-dioxygenase [Chloroherpetonaceae bacterium]MDW8438079.1 tryptophan 2,3-dioxygenase family protein [Chloroherpetonaceae bacterium]